MKQMFLSLLSVAICLLIIVGADTTAQAQTYCTPSFTFGCSLASIITGDDINTFTLTGASGTSINDLATGCSPGSYDDRTAESVTMNPGGSYNGTINSTSDISGSGENFQVFIDFNNDGTFQSSESVGGGASVAITPSTTPFTLTIPAGVATGSFRMRVVLCSISDAAYPSISPCASTSVIITTIPYSYGEVHDYTAVIGTTSSCGIPTGLAASSVTSTSAVLNWSEPTGSVGSEYVVTTTPGTPTGSGATTTALTYSPTGLTPSTVYYAYVRDSCGPGDFSAWVTTTFTTTATTTTSCNPVTGLTASPIASTTATISWTAVSGSVGYIWAVDMSATPPASGAFTTATSVPVTGLTAGTAYYAHVRDSCGAGSESTWVTITFTTTATTTTTCNPVTGLAASAITTTTATISWAAVSGSVGYIYAVDNSVTPPASGTFTTLTSASVSGLTAGTTYYAHVRDSCGAGSESSWVTIPFTTLALAGGCNAETVLTAGSITSTSAIISWVNASGAIGAEYVTNTTATGPTTSGTQTTASTYTASGLLPSTLYYAHVRDSCGATSLSAWVTIPIMTLAPAGVSNAPAADFSITAFPNPVKDEVTIKVGGAASANGQVQLIDISGKLLKTAITNAGILNMSMNGLPPGIYLIRYIDAEHAQTIKVNKM